jgi:YD repeat-containing protein
MSRPIGLTIKKYTTSQLNAFVANYGPSGIIQANSIDLGVVVYDKTVNRIKSFNGTTFITGIDSVPTDSNVTSITYVNGNITAFTSSGIVNTLTYDGSGRLSTISNVEGTKTITYNSDGSVATYQ